MKATTPVTKLRCPEAELIESVFSRLKGRVFHVTREAYLDSIIECGEIRPNMDGSYSTTFGSSGNSFFRNRDCVSLFDFKSPTPEKIDEYAERCWPLQPVSEDDGIAVLFISESLYPALLPWTLWKEQEAYREIVVPYIEAGHPGPIPIEKVDEILIVSVIEDTNSLAAALGRARRRLLQK
jgi:hypothetical protein